MPAACCSSASAANPTSSTRCSPRYRKSLRGRVRTLGAQDVEDEIEAGLALVDALVATAALAAAARSALGELVLGLKCGGSDGFSRPHRQPPGRPHGRPGRSAPADARS